MYENGQNLSLQRSKNGENYEIALIKYLPPLPLSPLRSLDGIPDSILPHFEEAAEQLIKEKGATNVVAAALAYISGAKEIISRSLLSSHQVVKLTN